MGSGFEKIRTKCMHCRQALELSGQRVAFHLLRRRKTFSAVLEDRIIDGHRSILHKSDGRIYISKVMEHSDQPHVTYVEYM